MLAKAWKKAMRTQVEGRFRQQQRTRDKEESSLSLSLSLPLGSSPFRPVPS